MKNVFKCIGIIALTAVIWFALAGCGASAKDFNYRVKPERTVYIAGYKGKAAKVSIPAKIEGMPVTLIARGAFSEKPLTSVTIPNSVTRIELSAFFNCSSLTSVTFAEGSAISEGNFGEGAVAYGSYPAFPGDLRGKYLEGGAGTYTREAGRGTWTKK
jgi:hypothetical protein